MSPEWERLIERLRVYTVKESAAILNMSIDSVLRKIVNMYEDVIGEWNAMKTYRSNIGIPGFVLLRYVEEHSAKPKRRSEE